MISRAGSSHNGINYWRIQFTLVGKLMEYLLSLRSPQKINIPITQQARGFPPGQSVHSLSSIIALCWTRKTSVRAQESYSYHRMLQYISSARRVLTVLLNFSLAFPKCACFSFLRERQRRTATQQVSVTSHSRCQSHPMAGCSTLTRYSSFTPAQSMARSGADHALLKRQ